MTPAPVWPRTAGGKDRDPQSVTLIMGGLRPSRHDLQALAHLGQSKNYKIVFPSFDPNYLAHGPVRFDAVITDGVADTIVMSGGELWKHDARSASILLFRDIRAFIKLSPKGRMLWREMRGEYDAAGHELARDAVLARASGEPGKAPVLSPLGGMTTVLDLSFMVDMVEAAG